MSFTMTHFRKLESLLPHRDASCSIILRPRSFIRTPENSAVAFLLLCPSLWDREFMESRGYVLWSLGSLSPPPDHCDRGPQTFLTQSISPRVNSAASTHLCQSYGQRWLLARNGVDRKTGDSWEKKAGRGAEDRSIIRFFPCHHVPVQNSKCFKEAKLEPGFPD